MSELLSWLIDRKTFSSLPGFSHCRAHKLYKEMREQDILRKRLHADLFAEGKERFDATCDHWCADVSDTSDVPRKGRTMQIIGDRAIMQDGTEYRVHNGIVGVAKEAHRRELLEYMLALLAQTWQKQGSSVAPLVAEGLLPRGEEHAHENT